MRIPSAAIVLAFLFTLVLAGCDDGSVTDHGGGAPGDQPAVAVMSHESPPPIDIEPLTARHTFTDDVAIQVRDKPAGRRTSVANLSDGSHLFVARITVQPGVSFPWHTHPGPVLVAVTQGELLYVYADDCVERPYTAGTAFVDPGFDNVHIAFNTSDTDEAVLIATFLGAPPAPAPLTLPVDATTAAQLDAKCGLSGAASHSH